MNKYRVCGTVSVDVYAEIDAPTLEDAIEYARDNSYIAFTVETLNYLRLNGRLSNSSAFVGNLLKIKPLMAVEDGIVVVKEKIRTKSKAVETLIDNFIQEIENKDVIPFLLYSNNYEELEEVLIMGDLGVRTTEAIIEDLKEKVKKKDLKY